MDLSRKLLETKEFASRRKGYDQEAVDDFLERVGVAIEDLQDQLTSALQRVDHLEVLGGAKPAGTQSLALAHKAARETRDRAERDADDMRNSLAEEKKLFEREAEQLVVALEQQKKQLDAARAKVETNAPELEQQAKSVLDDAKVAAANLRREIEARAALEVRDIEKAKEEAMILREEAERYSVQTRSEVDALASDAEDLLTGAQQAAEDIMSEARSRAQDSIDAVIVTKSSAGESEEDSDTLLQEAQAMRDKAEERVQQATLLRDEAEILMISAKSSAEVAQASSVTDARKQIAEERRQVRAKADGIFATAQREREALLAEAKAEVTELLGSARDELAAIGSATIKAREDLEQHESLIEDAREAADSLASEAVAKSSQLMSEARTDAQDRADKLKKDMRGEVTDLERARANLRFELVNLDGQIGSQKKLLSNALAEVAALDLVTVPTSSSKDDVDKQSLEAANLNRPSNASKKRKRRRKR